jgi:hypothetical protein
MIKHFELPVTSIIVAAAFVLTAAGGQALAQPTFGNPSPTAGTETSQKANAAADVAAYKEVRLCQQGHERPGIGSHSR